MGQEQDSTKQREWKQISEAERYKLEALIKAGHNNIEIAKLLGRDRRTIQRERNRGQVEQMDTELKIRKEYAADVGQRIKEERAARKVKTIRAHKGRPLKIGYNHALANYLQKAIVENKYSPDASMGALKRSEQAAIATVCTKTVYNYIDMQLFAGITNEHLPIKRQKKNRHKQIRRISLKNQGGKSIEERSEIIDLRKEEGHWEMDCVVGKQGTAACLLVMTERTNGVELIFKMERKTQECVAEVLDMLENRHKEEFSHIFKSITMDN